MSPGCTVARLSWVSNPPVDTKNTCRFTPRWLRPAVMSRATMASCLPSDDVGNGVVVAPAALSDVSSRAEVSMERLATVV